MINNLFNSVSDTGAETGVVAFILGFFAIFLIIILAYAIFAIIGQWKLYKKAGKQGWECIVPFYNNYVFMCEMAGLKWYWFVINLCAPLAVGFVSSASGDSTTLNLVVDVVAIICSLNVAYNVSAKIGKPNDIGNAILLLFFGGILYPVYGYSKNVTWNQNAPVTENGLFDKNKLNTENNNINSNSNQTVNSQPVNDQVVNTTQSTYQNNFDPNTGEPINKPVENKFNFDPVTGEKINKEGE